jgi:large subunit ribosomal protein L25
MAETKKGQRHLLEFEPRTEFGKEATKRLRASGLIPVIFYSGGEEAIPFQMTVPAMRAALHSGDRIFNVMIDDEQRRAMVKEIQYHPVTDEIIHVDFQGVRLRDVIEIPVPVTLVGEPVGVDEGGQIQHLVHEVTVRCKGADVPDSVEINVSKLEIGDGIQVGDVQTDKYEIQLADDITIVSVTHPQKMEIEAPVVEEDEDLEFEDEEGAEGEEGAEAEDGESEESKE